LKEPKFGLPGIVRGADSSNKSRNAALSSDLTAVVTARMQPKTSVRSVFPEKQALSRAPTMTTIAEAIMITYRAYQPNGCNPLTQLRIGPERPPIARSFPEQYIVRRLRGIF
jgi:hypothetical protein